jgi:hypothetical protein
MIRTRRHKFASFRPVIEGLEDRNLLSTYTVDHLTDDLVGSGLNGSLRYCILNAVDNDMITFGVTGTINLTGPLPSLIYNISIQGPGANQLTVRRNGGAAGYRIFTLPTSTTVSIAGLTIADGFFRAEVYGYGAGILNDGILTVDNCTISGNSSLGDPEVGPGYGGGIYNTGTLVLTNSTVSRNFTSDGSGAGIYNTGTLTLDNSTLSGNLSEDGDGGGIANVGIVTLNDSTLSGNLGGGIANASIITMNNSTISGNLNEMGGGIFNSYGSATINNSTIAGNSAGEAYRGVGGIYNLTGTLQVRNTIIAGNTGTAAPDLYGSLGSLGHNLIGNTQGGGGFDPTDLLNVDPLLGPLQDNGGLTLTMALSPCSPAIDAGDNTDAPEWDQRGPGFPRIVGIIDPDNPVIDIGAFEVQQNGGSRGLPLHGKPVHPEVAALIGMLPSQQPVSQIASEGKPLGVAVDAVFANDGAMQPSVVVGRPALANDVTSLQVHKASRQDLIEAQGFDLFDVFLTD